MDYEVTIDPVLFKAWVKNRRKGDPEEIVKLLGKSRPVIDKALKYGNVKDQGIIDGITKFYTERAEAERASGIELLKQSK